MLIQMYVAVASCGHGDEHYTDVIYAGLSEEQARQAVAQHGYQSEWNRFARIEIWVDGKLVRTIEVEVE